MVLAYMAYRPALYLEPVHYNYIHLQCTIDLLRETI